MGLEGAGDRGVEQLEEKEERAGDRTQDSGGERV